MSSNSPVFAMVAGETSGDLLGADLIRGLKTIYPDAIFEGIGGPKMQAEGFYSLFSMERLSVMGLIEPLKRLPELLRIRRAIVDRYKESPPLAFVGIDSPDFNTNIELKLHHAGIKTVHYVSPSVWAWRQGRIKTIKKAVDLMLTLLPFEAEFYSESQIPVRFVGHPLARQIPMRSNRLAAKKELELISDKPVLCLMPGSRAGEVALLAELFIAVAERAGDSVPGLQLVIPAANEARYEQLKGILSCYKHLSIKLLRQQSHLAMASSDAVLLASGTTALEAMLFKKPMVVSYRLGAITHALVSPFIKTPFVSIPNLLAGEMLVPELIQSDATVEALTAAIIDALDTDKNKLLIEQFDRLHKLLDMDSAAIAAEAIHQLVSS
ncbi:MAG: lipid-A-disaccharide synthase [Polaribacter sp.]|jgi:lipid-A-disaccharide synthase|tara:strand:- start:90 stop:1232 length:1143 start_codon:yes stop_codon:yes gene_type:complete